MSFTCPYSTPQVMVKVTRKETGHFVTLIKYGMQLSSILDINRFTYSVRVFF